MHQPPRDTNPPEGDKILRGRLPQQDRLAHMWLPEVGTRIPGRKGWRAVFAKLFLPYR